ncbi:MAG: OsmC family protein [Longimicrobiales bacterium]
MSDLIVSLTAATATRILHARSGAVIESAMAPEFGGPGGAFSSTDLLAAALGSCIATSLGPVAERHGIPLDSLQLVVRKELGQQPRRVTRLVIEVRCTRPISGDVLARLERATESCTVSRSLHPDLDVPICFVLPDTPVTPDPPVE